MGGAFFRISGSETRTSYDPDELPEGEPFRKGPHETIEHWLLNTCDGVVAAIDYVYFRREPEKFDGLCLKTLDRHRLADFELLPDEEGDA